METQGRGGLHAHISVWVKHGLAGLDVDKLRHGKLEAAEMEALEKRLAAWRTAVLEAVSTVQFDSVEEFARQVGLEKGDLEPLPLSSARQATTFVDGDLEKNDVAVLKAPVQAFPAGSTGAAPKAERVPWRDDPPQGPSRKRGFAPVHASLPKNAQPSREQPLYRRLPRYQTSKDTGRARVVGVVNKKAEARLYGKTMAWDARRNFAKNHRHVCMPTCFPKKGAGRTGESVRLCRFGHWHVREVAVPPRRYPKRVSRCRNPECPRRRDGDLVWEVRAQSGRLRCVKAHPWHCAASLAVASEKAIRRYHRQGKALVLPTPDEEAAHRQVQAVAERLGDGTRLCPDFQRQRQKEDGSWCHACELPVKDGCCAQGEHRCGAVLYPGDRPHVCGGQHSAGECSRRRRLLPVRACTSAAKGLGKPEPWRYGPDCSSSHPGVQVGFRCNVDVQNTERVYVLVVKRKMRRWRRVPMAADADGEGSGARDEAAAGGPSEPAAPVEPRLAVGASSGPGHGAAETRDRAAGREDEAVLAASRGPEKGQGLLDASATQERPVRPDEEDFVGVVRADFLRARAFVTKRRAEEDFFTQLRVKREARRRFNEERDPAKSEAMEAVPVEDRPLPCASDLLRSYLAQREALGDAADDMLIRRRLATDTGLARCEVLQGLLQSLGEGVHVSGA